jgi:predicted MFS family arabinose efflux permease
MIFNWQDVAPVSTQASISLLHVLRKIWAPGLAMALASSGVGTISAFLTLRYQLKGWGGAAFALTGFGVAYIFMRLLFAELPDRFGGQQTGAASLLVEAIGLTLIWHSNSPTPTLVGAVLTGIGYSLVFPSMGVEAMRRVPSESRGLVLGTFLACFDLGLALSGPGSGLVANTWGIPAAFLAAALAAIIGLGVLLSNSMPSARRDAR